MQKELLYIDLEDNEMLQWEESVREMYDDIACKPGPNPVGLQLLHPDRFSNLKLPPASVPLISLPDQMYSLDEPLVHHIDIEIDQPDPPRICDLFDMMSFKENRVRRSASRKVVRETSFDGDLHNCIQLKKLESENEDKISGSLQAESISDSSAGSYKKSKP